MKCFPTFISYSALYFKLILHFTHLFQMRMRLVLSCLERGARPSLTGLKHPVFWTKISYYSTTTRTGEEAVHGSPPPTPELLVAGKSYARDDFTNVTPRMLSHLGRNLHLRPQHPLGSVLVHTLKIIFEEGKGTVKC